MLRLAVVQIFKIVFGDVDNENPRLFFANNKKIQFIFSNFER
jgi:hypothetical protein